MYACMHACLYAVRMYVCMYVYIHNNYVHKYMNEYMYIICMQLRHLIRCNKYSNHVYIHTHACTHVTQSVMNSYSA